MTMKRPLELQEDADMDNAEQTEKLEKEIEDIERRSGARE